MAEKLTFEEVRKRGLLIYEYIRGSHAYGLATETSDEDRGGVYICPPDELLGLGFEYQQQIQNDSHDIVWFELNRFLQLLVEKANPTCLESLFIPDRCIIYEHPIMTEIKKYRNMFITKKCFGAFSGYSKSQIEKAQGLNKKIVNPVTERLSPLDFCYVTHKQGSGHLTHWLEYRGLNQKYCGLVSIPNMKGYYGCYYDWGNFFKYENITLDDLLEMLHDRTVYDTISIVREMKEARKAGLSSADEWEALLRKAQRKNMVNFILEKYHLQVTGPGVDDIEQDVLFTSWFNSQKPIGYCGIISESGDSNEVRFYDIEKVEHSQKDDKSVVLCSIPKGEEPIVHIYFNKDGYSVHCREYKEYKEWEQNRNPERYRTNVEHNRGYDSKNMCHSARLMVCGKEIAETGQFNVDRSGIDREFLLSIKRGEYPYDELIKFAKQKDAEIREAMKKSTLPESVDPEFVNNLLLSIRHRQLNGEF